MGEQKNRLPRQSAPERAARMKLQLSRYRRINAEFRFAETMKVVENRAKRLILFNIAFYGGSCQKFRKLRGFENGSTHWGVFEGGPEGLRSEGYESFGLS